MIARDYHPRWKLRVASRRESFHTSPQLSQRQYVLASGFFSVVTMAEDWQAGHVSGLRAPSRGTRLRP
jgi:hypothetical protein